jgi:hypothetical protein
MQITTIGLGLLFASRPVGFLRPANPISVGFAEGQEPRTQIGALHRIFPAGGRRCRGIRG